MDHAKIARATRHKNTTVLLDVLTSTCNRDARDLVYNDFQALMIWHKHNSYQNTPYNVTWQSKYGVRGTATVKQTEPRETKIKCSPDEYAVWRTKGFSLPTARDLEVFDSIKDDKEKEDIVFLFDRAQWIDPVPLQSRIDELAKKGDRAASVTARIEELDRRGIGSFPEIDSFAEAFNDFGIQEFAKVKLEQTLFDPPVAIEALRTSIGEHREANLLEADAIEKWYATDRPAPGTKYEPQAEEVPLVLSLWSMFPWL
jgi:hypothetical protein